MDCRIALRSKYVIGSSVIILEKRHIAALLTLGEMRRIYKLVLASTVRTISLDRRLFQTAALYRLWRFVGCIAILRPDKRIWTKRLDELEWIRRRICNGKADSRIIIGQSLALKMKAHDELSCLVALEDFRTLQHASALNVALLSYGKRDSLVLPIA